MKLPNLIIGGAQKAGTTSFYDLIKDHPDIFVPHQKELHYFDVPDNYSKGLGWYSNFFNEASDQKYRVDCTPDYLHYSYVAPNIKDLLGSNIKLIFFLRQPVKRAYSQFQFYRSHLVETENNFEKAISKEIIKSKIDQYDLWYNPPHYLSRSLYYEQLRKYYELFPLKNILIICFEDLVNQTDDTIRSICSFLQIDNQFDKLKQANKTMIPKNNHLMRFFNTWFPNDIIKSLIPTSYYNKIRNKTYESFTTAPSKISENLVNELTEKYFAKDIILLEELTGRSYDRWYISSN